MESSKGENAFFFFFLLPSSNHANLFKHRDDPTTCGKLRLVTQVEKYADTWEDGGRTPLDDESRRLRPLIGTVTSFDEDGGYINQSTYFPFSSLWEGIG